MKDTVEKYRGKLQEKTFFEKMSDTVVDFVSGSLSKIMNSVRDQEEKESNNNCNHSSNNNITADNFGYNIGSTIHKGELSFNWKTNSKANKGKNSNLVALVKENGKYGNARIEGDNIYYDPKDNIETDEDDLVSIVIFDYNNFNFDDFDINDMNDKKVIDITISGGIDTKENENKNELFSYDEKRDNKINVLDGEGNYNYVNDSKLSTYYLDFPETIIGKHSLNLCDYFPGNIYAKIDIPGNKCLYNIEDGEILNIDPDFSINDSDILFLSIYDIDNKERKCLKIKFNINTIKENRVLSDYM